MSESECSAPTTIMTVDLGYILCCTGMNQSRDTENGIMAIHDSVMPYPCPLEKTISAFMNLASPPLSGQLSQPSKPMERDPPQASCPSYTCVYLWMVSAPGTASCAWVLLCVWVPLMAVEP
jgi:hypothetical protein